MSEPPDRDPFAGLHLDEDFVRAAELHEPSARARSNASGFEQAPHTSGAGPTWSRRRRWRRRGGGLRRYAAVLVVVAFVASAAFVSTLQRSSESEGASPGWSDVSVGPIVSIAGTDERPTPVEAASTEPLGTPSLARTGEGSFEFLQVQPDDQSPVAYDPCRPIRVAVNPSGEPIGARGLISESLATISEVSGLRFELDDPTDEPPAADRPPYQPERYGDRWAPVLVAWSDPTAVPELAGQVAGIGGSVAYPPGPDEALAYVSGLVILDGPQLEELLAFSERSDAVRAIILHELAHVVGLGHVDDPDELMHPQGQEGIFELQAGDRAGLAELGRGACFPLL